MKAAVLTGKNEKWTKVTDIPTPLISNDQLLVKTVAFAANPTDWKRNFPVNAGNVSGADASGTVVEIGSNVTGFEVGDVVSILVHAGINKVNGGFADYVATVPGFAIKHDKNAVKDTPLSVGNHGSGPISTFEQAAAVTLGLATIVYSFVAELGISQNTLDNKDKAILIWGGSTASGVIAIQLAKLSFGLKVFTTSSKRNHAYLKQLGADAVFDYSDADVVNLIKKEAGDSIAYALDTVGTESTTQHVYDSTANSKHVEIDGLLLKGKDSITLDPSRLVNYHTTVVYRATGAEVTIAGKTFEANEDAAKKYLEYWTNELPKVLPHLRAHNLQVLEPGLESVNEALLMLHDGKVSAQKIVFRNTN